MPQRANALTSITVILLPLALVATLVAAQNGQDDATTADTAAAAVDAEEYARLVERGAYLANHASMCVECHSPRNAQGELREDRLFAGASMPVKSPFPGPRWAFTAPNLRRAPGYTQEEFVTFMGSGKTPNGTYARGPMPQFRMTRGDANALWAYLHSL